MFYPRRQYQVESCLLQLIQGDIERASEQVGEQDEQDATTTINQRERHN